MLGSGAREHALFWKLMQSELVEVVYAAPGSGSTQAIRAAVAIDPKDPKAVLDVVKERNIDLTVIGPDDVVAAGVADALTIAGKQVFGPTAAAGRVESSKAFAKELMQAAGVPTAPARIFDDARQAQDYARAHGSGLVVKADGLALGKGVTVCETVEHTVAAIDRAMLQGVYGEAGRRVVLEERINGKEASIMCFCDGKRVLAMEPARDYKRAGDGDTGPNTGGMGAYSPPSDVGAEVRNRVVRECAQPAVDELARRGTPYLGCLYVQVMLTADGPRVIEYNSRFGDPETQVVLPRLKGDLAYVMRACAAGDLDGVELDWDGGATVGVVVASGGYPGSYDAGKRIEGLLALEQGVVAFHAGTRFTGEGFVTSGGRVLTVVASGPTVEAARENAYRNVEKVRFDGAFFRRDIAAA